MVVAVPGERVPTLYTATGEVVPLLALAYCAIVAVRFIPRGTRL